jgi:predicted enzyme related to lactoylglutathione lyase
MEPKSVHPSRLNPGRLALGRLNAASVGANGDADLVDHHGCFTWYELMTTDVAAAKAFYAHVLGWDVQDASTPDLAYTIFTAGTASVGGLMELPEAARKMGATPRWMGYVGVDDLDATTDRIKHLGGAVYVPPTDTNIGRIAVVADPQTVNLALLKGAKPGQPQPADLDQPGRVGWHELHAADWKRAFAFYREIFGWQKANAEPSDSYRLFSAAGQTLGGMFTKRPNEPAPFWLFYFNIGDVDAAAERVKSGGGQIMAGPLEIPGRSWVIRCTDPQGAVFALEGTRSPENIGRQPEVGWTTEWGEFSSKGRLVGKPRSKP